MLIRDLDRADEEIGQLKRLLDREVTSHQKFLIETELRRLAGKPAAGVSPVQILDFYCSNTSKWAVLHNLKLETSTGLERIDHLVISCYFDVVLLNSACFYHDLKISVDGQYKLFDGREYQPILSPMTKCSRQLDILSKVFQEEILAPTRIGVPLRPKFHIVVLVSPTRNVLRPPASLLDTSHVMAANQFIHRLLRHQIGQRSGLAKLAGMTRFCTRRTLERIARELAALHQTACIDFTAEMRLDQKICLADDPETPPGDQLLYAAAPRTVQPKQTTPELQPLPDTCGGTS